MSWQFVGKNNESEKSRTESLSTVNERARSRNNPVEKIGDGVQVNKLVAMVNLSEATSRGFDNFD